MLHRRKRPKGLCDAGNIKQGVSSDREHEKRKEGRLVWWYVVARVHPPPVMYSNKDRRIRRHALCVA